MPARKRLSALILAAGLSRRAAPHNKLLAAVRGQTVVHATVNAFVEACVGEVVVVTGHERERIQAALDDLPVRFVFAKDFADGMSNSLAAGIRSFAASVEGFLVSPGDLPELTPGLVRRVASAFHAHHGERHIVPTHAEQRGHPVALGAWLRPQLETLTGDVGARSLLATDAERVRTVFLPIENAAIFRDVDSGELAKPGAQCFDTSRQT